MWYFRQEQELARQQNRCENVLELVEQNPKKKHPWPKLVNELKNHLTTQNEPHHKKISIWGFRIRLTQTGLLSYRDSIESWNFRFSKTKYYTIQTANNKGAAQMRRLICAFVVRIWHKQVFSWCGSNLKSPVDSSYVMTTKPKKTMNHKRSTALLQSVIKWLAGFKWF